MPPAPLNPLRKIAVADVRLGMHLHKLEGPWLKHPFWKTRFVIRNADELALLQASGVAECWIDTALGVDVAAAGDAPAAAATAPVLPASAPKSRPLAEELRQAAAICERGREAVAAMFAEARMGRSIDAESCMPLVEDIAASVLRSPGALVSLARLKSRDDYSYMHSVAVCALMVALARQLGFDEPACRQAGTAGLLHDIGKALMPLEVLNKPGRLTDAEYQLIRSHPARGHALLLEGRGASAETLDVVLHHHERWDGRGYPAGLAGSQISQLARMGAVCDVYDAITSNRPYKAGWDPAESIASMASWKGQFDETIFAAFVQSLGIYPVGSQVRLASGKLAVVVEQNPHKLVAPVVKVFFSTKSQLHLPPERLDLARPGCSDRIVGRVPREEGAEAERRQAHLDELWAGPEVLQRVHRRRAG